MEEIFARYISKLPAAIQQRLPKYLFKIIRNRHRVRHLDLSRTKFAETLVKWADAAAKAYGLPDEDFQEECDADGDGEMP